MQLFAPSFRLYLFKSSEKECVCSLRVRGGGVLAGVEQSCNEQILEREREAKKQERTDDLVELGYYNNNPDFGER